MTLTTDDEVRGVRRIFLLALAAALAAAGVTLGIELSHEASSRAQPSLMPATFREPGFADGTLHLRQQTTVPGRVRMHRLHTGKSSGSVVYVVVRCDTGTATVRLGGLTSAQACSGRPVGLVRLTLAKGGAALQVTVNHPQRHDWAIGLYR
ncbi:MAG TPA: hypothetical protein VFH66_08815 [Mycobacteriales bacterium]|nr:hypothetical protein [Mycobacteriales bacterium]